MATDFNLLSSQPSLRVLSLQMALQHSMEGEEPTEIVKMAELFYKYMAEKISVKISIDGKEM